MSNLMHFQDEVARVFFLQLEAKVLNKNKIDLLCVTRMKENEEAFICYS